MKMLVAGNPTYGVAAEIYKLYPDAEFRSRTTDYDLGTTHGHEKFANESINFDVIILCSALHKFNQTILLHNVYNKLVEKNLRSRVICLGSTVDKTNTGKIWLYSAEKKALNDYCNTLNIHGVWNKGPRVTLFSFGSLSNVQHKHPGRKCIDINKIALYVKWIIEQPEELCINELSIDPLQ